MIRIATVFSGIGAAEQALKQLGVDHRIVFACDNGERYLKQTTEDIESLLVGKDDAEVQEIINALYEKTNKPNNVKASYVANYDDILEDWYEDIRFLNGNKYKGDVDIRVGGSPCQSFSTYGKRKGLEDTRGTLVFNIDVMLAKRKMSVTQLAEKVGITLANMSILKTGKAKAIKVSTLIAICDALDCQPGDILEFREED